MLVACQLRMAVESVDSQLQMVKATRLRWKDEVSSMVPGDRYIVRAYSYEHIVHKQDFHDRNVACRVDTAGRVRLHLRLLDQGRLIPVRS